jgi:hypothetical protein
MRRLEVAPEHVVEVAQPRQRPVEHDHIRPIPAATRAAWVPTTPPPITATLPGATPGMPPRARPPAIGLLQRPGPDLRREPPRDLDMGASSGSPPCASVTVS